MQNGRGFLDRIQEREYDSIRRYLSICATQKPALPPAGRQACQKDLAVCISYLFTRPKYERIRFFDTRSDVGDDSFYDIFNQCDWRHHPEFFQ